MRSEMEKASAELLYLLKDQKKRFIVLEPCENGISLNMQTAKPILKLNYYEALINARAHTGSLKGKYAFVFDLENESHLGKLEQLVSNASDYFIYANIDIVRSVKAGEVHY